MATKNDTASNLEALSATIDGAAAIVASVADSIASMPNETRQLYAVQALLESLTRDLDRLVHAQDAAA